MPDTGSNLCESLACKSIMHTLCTHDTHRLLAHQEDIDESGHQLGIGGMSVGSVVWVV